MTYTCEGRRTDNTMGCPSLGNREKCYVARHGHCRELCRERSTAESDDLYAPGILKYAIGLFDVPAHFSASLYQACSTLTKVRHPVHEQSIVEFSTGASHTVLCGIPAYELSTTNAIVVSREILCQASARRLTTLPAKSFSCQPM